MEWLEITARSVDEAKELLLDQLGVDGDDAEFEVIEEPKPGLFGRVRGEARVRARVRPAQVRQKVDRRRREKAEKPAAATNGSEAAAGSDDAQPAEGAAAAAATAPSATRGGERSSSRPSRPRREERAPRPERTESDVTPQQVADEAERFVGGLLDAFDIAHRTEVLVDGEHIDVRVHGEQLGLLVGPRGTTLQALQEIIRIVAQRKLGDHDTRLTVDVGGYRERRRQALERFAQQVASEVLDSGEPRALEPMTSTDRKVVHDTLSTIDGISTRSEGDDPNRRVVILPAVAHATTN
jgi:spoIIIJ-associated protein